LVIVKLQQVVTLFGWALNWDQVGTKTAEKEYTHEILYQYREK